MLTTLYITSLVKIKVPSDNFTICKTQVYIKKKVKQSRYTPWRRFGGEEV